jgi:hypothetical protein
MRRTCLEHLRHDEPIDDPVHARHTLTTDHRKLALVEAGQGARQNCSIAECFDYYFSETWWILRAETLPYSGRQFVIEPVIGLQLPRVHRNSSVQLTRAGQHQPLTGSKNFVVRVATKSFCCTNPSNNATVTEAVDAAKNIGMQITATVV